MARLIHQCPSCHWVVTWPEFTPVLKAISPDTVRLLATTGTLVPWVSQCPHCKGTFSKDTILTGGKYDVPHVQKDSIPTETTPTEREGKETKPLHLPGSHTQEKEE
jgi:hypothetical protein